MVFGALYDKDHLAKAVDECLGVHASTRLKDVEHGLLVPAIDWLGGELARVEMLSIGTAGAERKRAAAKADRSGLGWAPELAVFMIDVQERTAAAQAARLLGQRYLRVNHQSGRGKAFEEMDVANHDTRAELMKAGREVAAVAYKRSGAFIDRFLSADRKRRR